MWDMYICSIVNSLSVVFFDFNKKRLIKVGWSFIVKIASIIKQL